MGFTYMVTADGEVEVRLGDYMARVSPVQKGGYEVRTEERSRWTARIGTAIDVAEEEVSGGKFARTSVLKTEADEAGRNLADDDDDEERLVNALWADEDGLCNDDELGEDE